VDQSLQTVVVVAMALLVLVVSTTDLSIDFLRVDAEQLPLWLINLTATITNDRDAEGLGQKRVRRIIETLMVVGALASPVYILTRKGADESALTWSVAFWLTAVLWLIWLTRRPRRPVPGSAEESEWEMNRAARRAAAKTTAKTTSKSAAKRKRR
jgi:hypothetical protein